VSNDVKVQGTRERLVSTAADLFGRQGLSATGIKQILAGSNAQFSSLYHHFPGGKDQLAAEAIRTAGLGYQQFVENIWDGAGDLLAGVRSLFEGAAYVLDATDYADACPIATIALEVASTNEDLRLATAEVFESWNRAAVARFVRGGIPPAAARELAVAMIALLEGAFILSRAAKSPESMLVAGRTAVAMVERALDSGGAAEG
jgi:AcrR family transcriptional regulator